ncbi:TPA: hypothetical protein ACKQDY_004379 [Serratia marcescens]|uniref:hypothetical protein n=1 Tax=Serratia marcescens TaxID=615 RepID=UPI003204B5F4|nr:hypothetical protein [Serratia marcescens]
MRSAFYGKRDWWHALPHAFINEEHNHEHDGPSIIIGILVMLALWLGALFNIGDITLSISRLFHWIESQRG